MPDTTIKTFEYNLDGVRFTADLFYNESGFVTAKVTMLEGSADFNSILWADNEGGSDNFAFTGDDANLNINVNCVDVKWDNGYKMGTPQPQNIAAGKDTFLEAGETGYITLPRVTSLDSVDALGFKGTNASTPDGEINAVAGEGIPATCEPTDPTDPETPDEGDDSCDRDDDRGHGHGHHHGGHHGGRGHDRDDDRCDRDDDRDDDDRHGGRHGGRHGRDDDDRGHGGRGGKLWDRFGGRHGRDDDRHHHGRDDDDRDNDRSCDRDDDRDDSRGHGHHGWGKSGFGRSALNKMGWGHAGGNRHAWNDAQDRDDDRDDDRDNDRDCDSRGGRDDDRGGHSWGHKSAFDPAAFFRGLCRDDRGMDDDCDDDRDDEDDNDHHGHHGGGHHAWNFFC